jgi:amino acid transporter
MYNEAGMGIAGSSIMFLLWGMPILGGDFATLFVVSIILSLIILLTYYMLSVSMPRTGADYVYSSRLLHPALGVLAAGFAGIVAPLANIGYAASGWVTAGLAPLLSYASFVTGNSGLVDLATTLSTPLAVFIIAALTTIIFGLILAVAGMKKYFQLQNILVGIGALAQVVMIAVVLNTSHSAFVSAFDSIATKYGTSYSGIISQASQAGWTAPPLTALQALFVVPEVLSSSWWASQSSVFAGEIKRVRSSQLVGMLGSCVIFTTLFFINYILTINMVGYNFAAAMSYFAFNNPSAVPVPVLLPFPGMFYYGLASHNLVLAVVISLGPICGLFVMTGWCIVIFSRYVFAMSFDRVLPEGVSSVSDRFHTPVKAVALATVLSIAMLGIFEVLSQLPSAASYVYYVGISANVLIQVAAFLSALGLTLFAYLHKDLYEQVFPFKRKIAGIPIATWTGALTMGILVYSLDIWFLQPFSALVYGGFPVIAYMLMAFAVILLAAYVFVRAFRTRQGIDLSLVFKEIPPE